MRSFPANNQSIFLPLYLSAKSAGGGVVGGDGIIGGLIMQAWKWLVDRCNAPNVGYSQSYRNEITKNGITYYDCSSIIYYALCYGGFSLDVKAWPFTTRDMGNALDKLGFAIVPMQDNMTLQAGDILIRNNSYGRHTEMMYDSTYSMGAHSAKLPLADQVSISTTPVNISTWDVIYRYPTQVSGNWITRVSDNLSQSTLTQQEMEINARIIYKYFNAQGWTNNAIAAVLGNMQGESTLNPGTIETGGSGGHGLVQWTPATSLYNGLDALYGGHDDWYNGDKQVSLIQAELQQSSGEKDWGIEPQWYQKPQYPISFRTFSKSTKDMNYLVMAFQYNYLRPFAYHTERIAYANNWFNFISNL